MSILAEEAWNLKSRLMAEFHRAEADSLRRFRLAAAAARAMGRYQRRALKAFH
jgi:hypothetical protein